MGSRVVILGVAAALLGVGFAGGWLARGQSRAREAARTAGALFEIELFTLSPTHQAHSTLCLLDGKHGQVIQDGQRYNRNSHVDFHHYAAGSFTAGVQGGENGQVIDLGDVSDLRGEYGGDPLRVLRWRDGRLFARGEAAVEPEDVGAPSKDDSVLAWVGEIFDIAALVKKGPIRKSAPVKAGHVYFVRITGARESPEIVGLLHVLDHDPGVSVKLRVALP